VFATVLKVLMIAGWSHYWVDCQAGFYLMISDFINLGDCLHANGCC